MNIYDAIMKAAEHIDLHPGLFNFMSPFSPSNDCGTPGCALGWIAYFMGDRNECVLKTAATALGFDLRKHPMHSGHPFYDRMQKLQGSPKRYGDSWRYSATECARILRLYAAKYHTSPAAVVPDWNAMAAKQTVATDSRSEELVS